MGKFGPIDVIVLNSHGVGQVCHIKRFRVAEKPLKQRTGT